MSGDPENLIEFRCSNCTKRLKAKAKLAGKRIACPKCSKEIQVPQSFADIGASSQPPNGTSTSNSDLAVLSAKNLDDLGNLAAEVLSSPEPKKPASNNSSSPPRQNSFDVEDLQLESLAISDLADRQRDSEEIRFEKETKRRLQLAAEERRRQDTRARENEGREEPVPQPLTKQPVASTSDEDDYNLLPEITPQNTQARANMASVLDDELLPKLAAESPKPNAKPSGSGGPKGAPKAVGGSKAGSSSNANSEPKDLASTNPDDFGNLDSLVPELDPAPSLPNSLEFFDDTIEDRYRIACPVCGTIQYVAIQAKGKQTKCPDCFSKYQVPGPPANWVPSKVAKRHDNFDSDAPMTSASDQELRRIDKQRKQATNELLDRAESDLEKEKNDEDRYGVADFDTNSFLRRTFGFLRDPVAVGFVFGYGLVFALVFAMIQYGISHANDGETGRGAALFFIICGPLIGLLFGLPMISAALAQLEAVANHQAKVVDWPGFDMFDNLGDLFSVGIAIGMSAIPGFIIGFYLGGDGAIGGRIILAAVVFSVLMLFPLFLLSILDTGNLFGLVSKDVLRSMKEVSEAWASYYFKSFLFIAVAMVFWFLLLGKGKSAIFAGLAGFSFPLLVFFLFQQVGALADSIGEHLSFSFAGGSNESDEDQVEDLEDSL